ncbi:unnamed protein product [Closterium sp. Naga37s-1]|nr:unnamed protein product [Closterium sp. Naga37s-1]
MPLERLTDTGRHDARVDQSSAAEQTSDDSCIGDGGKEEYDALVVGAGIAGCALAYSLGKTGRRVLVLERDLAEPDRIVGELLQPGGYLKLVELGMQDCVDGIDAQRVDGYALFMDGGDCKVSYPTLSTAQLHMLFAGHRLDSAGSAAGEEMWKVAGRGFHNGRFVQRLREKAASLPTVTLREATVLGLLEDGDRVTGVRYRAAKRVPGSAQGEVREASAVGGKGETEEGEMLAPLTFVCDGCFSNLRRSISKSKVDVPSSFVGLLLRDCPLPHPNYGHVVLADPSPVLFYPVSTTEVRCLVDIPAGTKVPSIASGDMADYLLSAVLPQLPKQLQGPFREAVRAGDIRCMPNRIMPAVPVTRPGALLMGDAFNMRHPLTGGGMTVALSDVSVLTQILRPLKVFRNTRAVCEYAEAFYTRRKPIAATINTLSIALYRVFCASKDEAMMAMRQACFDYLQLGGACSEGPISLLSGLNPQPLSLVLHFFAVAFFALARLLLPLPKPGRVWLGARLIQGAVQLIVPIIKAEGVRRVFFPAVCPSYYKSVAVTSPSLLLCLAVPVAMAEAVAVVRAKKKAEANGERDGAVLTRSESLLDEKFDAYEAANYRMWARSKSEAFSRRKASGSRSNEQHNLDFLDSYGYTPQNAELMTRVEESSSINQVARRDKGEQGYGGDGVCRGDFSESGAAERLTEEGRVGGGGSKTKGARDSSGNSSSASSGSLESAAEDERGLRGFLRYCRKKVRQATMRADESCADDADSADSEDGAEGGEGKATAAGALLKRSLTEDTTGKTMARDALNGLPRSTSDVLQDAEMDEMDREVLQEAFVRVVALQQRVQHYRDLGGFVVLMALFITILYLQADSSRSYEITAAHAVLFPPGMSQDSSNTFSGPGDFYSWLNTSIVQTLWADPTCGDGSCDRPFQFPAFGRFGCQADCGTFPNLTSVVVRLSSQLDTQQAADESSWNLCMVNPVSLCWYESFQPFPRGESEVSVAVDIPDGDWVVVLNAPAGGIRGTVHAPPPGTQRFSVVGAASTIELAAWGYCALDDGVAAANQTEPSGGTAGSAPDICRDTCARLVGCLPATCGRAFTEREVAGAFVDCARMCIVAPSSITTYAGFTCPMADIASLFANTPCNVSGSDSAVHESGGNRRKALYRFHHSHTYERWPASAAPGPLDTSSLPTAAGVRSLAAPAVDSPAASASAAATALAEAYPQEAQRYEVTPVSTPPSPAAAAMPTGSAAATAAAAAMAAQGTAAATDPTEPSLWSLLGATDRQRLRVLQVAVSRALFTVTKDQCLVGHGPGASRKHSQGGPGSVRWNMVACFCTMLGGPSKTLDECRLTDTAGQQVVTIAGMHSYLRSTHVRGGRVISAQHMRRFVQMVGAALSSVTLISDAAAARLNALMHSFDDAIVTSHAVGCSQGGAWLPWRAGVKHNTTIYAGDKVTWVWDDDLPHSLKVAAMGEADDPLFLGFGGHRLVVSRKMACTHMNVGQGDTFEEPQPCVLKMDDESPGFFAYSKVFDEPITIHYEDGTLSVDDSSSSSSTSASSLLTVLPARAGAEVAGAVNATDSSTLSGTAHFTIANTVTPSTSTSTSTSSSSEPYKCSPGCRLQRLANGVCDAACNTPACAFDGGDCACVDPLFGPGICACPPGHTRRDDGSCCLSTAVGANLNFPFSLQRYGPNYTESNFAFAAERGLAVNRFVSHRNRLLIGMVLQQDRWGTQHCNGTGLLHLEGWCSNGTSTEPFGVNPHFLPTSAIYDSAASANMSQLDNSTFGVKLRFNPQGLPYGFIYPMDSLTTLPLVFDINLDYHGAMRRLHYLVDGSYIDNGTRTVDVSFITFNGDTLTFVLTTVKCMVNAGGAMAVSIKSQPAAMAMYDASADNIARLVLEMVYLVGLLWNVCGELQEMADRAAKDGYVFSYFGCFWNWVDMLSLTLQVAAVVIWVVLWRYVDAFDMQPRYDIYYTLLEMPRYWAVPNPPTGFISATQAFADLRNIINLRAVYFALQGINLFFMMTRLLKVMDFQPYLGVITRSLSVATPSLLHFFLLSFAVFFCFSMYGYLVFGGALEMFSTVLESMFSCFLLLLNDNSSAYFFQRLESWDLIAAMLFFFMFIVFMVFILLNFLIAIIVDAFMSVKDSNIVATSITSDLAHIFKYKWNCWRGRYLHYSFILERLVQLGAKDTRVESDRRMRRMRSVQRRTRAMFCGDCGNNKPESSNSDSRVRRQHVLTVREKRIDAISLAMILQRRHDRERGGPHEHELLPTCWPKAASSETAEEEQLEQLEQLSQAVVLQCGEVVKQSALPVKKPVQKLSLAHIKVGKEGGALSVANEREGIPSSSFSFSRQRHPLPSTPCVFECEQEDLARSEAAVKELRGMLALVLNHLARTHPLEDAAHAMGAPADPSAGSSMRRCHTEPAPLSDLLTDSPQPLEPAGSRREVPRRFSDTGAGGGGVEGQERHGNVRGSLSIAGGSASRSLLASKQGSERRVSFKECTAANRKSPLRTGGEWQQQPPPSNQYRTSDFDSGASGPPAHVGHRQNSS